MTYDIGRKIDCSAASWAFSLTVSATIARVASQETPGFPESISATSDGTPLIAGAEKGIMVID
jgi:hypothetical protein